MPPKTPRLPTPVTVLAARRAPAGTAHRDVSNHNPATRPTTTTIGGLGTIVRRRLPSICAMTLGSLALAALYLLVTPPAYVASTTLFIDPRPKKVVSEDAAQGGLGTDLALLESQVAIIRSDTVLSRVVEGMQLADDPEFAPQPSRGFASAIKSALGIKPVLLDPKSQALASLAQRITVKRAQKTYVVEIEAASGSPVKAARIAQGVVDAYLADQTSAKSGEAQRANLLIDSRLGELREQVRRAETRVDDFRKANRILTSEGLTVGEQQLTRLNGELINARTQAAEAKARIDEVATAAKSGNPDVITDPSRTGLVQRLREQLALVARREASLTSQLLPRHPVLIDIHSQVSEIKAQIAAELHRLAANAKADYQVAASREKELSHALETTKLEVGRTNTAQIKQRELEQEVAASRELMRVFLARSKETDEQQKISTPDARMISPPSVPQRPAKPVPALILGLGLLAGLAGGLARALMLDHLDSRITSGADLERRTGLTMLAAIPAFTPAKGKAFPSRDGPTPTAIEASSLGDLARAIRSPSRPDQFAYRRAITGLMNRVCSAPTLPAPHVLLLASPLSASGTSATAFSIAFAAAGRGGKVLLIDASADMALSDALAPALPTHAPIALDNVDDLDLIIVRDPRSGLAFLPIALADLRSLTTVQRARLYTGLTQLTQVFDLIVIDGGAVLEDEGAAIMLGLADEVALVARAGVTHAGDLTDASGQLDTAQAKFAGVILTRADPAAG